MLPPAADGRIPLRLEIRQLRADQYKWDLFILALSMLQSSSQDDPLSWYQIAGIHGVPFQPWNEVQAVDRAENSGYCTHSSVLFPMWHQPYMALFEQQVFRMANSIADMFSNMTERLLYQRAARELRLPYWNWSRAAQNDKTHLPDVFWRSLLVQNGPNGRQTIKNPLYSYEFHPLDANAFIWSPLNQWNETKRGADTNVSFISPPSDNKKVNAELLTKLLEIQQRLYILFSDYHDFNSFGNKAWAMSQGLPRLDSIEAVHNVIHIYGRSKGHLTYVPLSSFDPLFLLHHTMTDRLIAIWQLLNPTLWMTPMPTGETTFTATKGTLKSSDSPLTPFYAHPNGTFWTSDMARTTEAFGYAYADTDTSMSSKSEVRYLLMSKINKWYGSSSPVGLIAKAQTVEDSARSQARAGETEFDEPLGPGAPKTANASQLVRLSRYTEWIASVHADTGELDGALSIYIFLGEPPTDKSAWASAANLIGSMAIITMGRMNEPRSETSGAVPLTSALMRLAAAGWLADLAPATVTPILRKDLKIRILGPDDGEVEPRLVKGLHVTISSSDVEIPETQVELPRWKATVTRLKLWA